MLQTWHVSLVFVLVEAQRKGKYFSRKHKQFGYKTAVYLLANGMDIVFGEHEPGSGSDVAIFEKMQYFHKEQLPTKNSCSYRKVS